MCSESSADSLITLMLMNVSEIFSIAIIITDALTDLLANYINQKLQCMTKENKEIVINLYLG